MKLRKMMTSLTLLLLLAPLAFAIPKKIAAEFPQEITFVLHKRVFYTLGAEESVRMRPNSGLELLPDNVTEENQDLIDPTKTYGLNGVTFDIYDATDYVMDRLLDSDNPQTLEEISQEVLSADMDELREELTDDNLITSITTARDIDTGELGMASVTRDFSETGTENSALLFLERPVETNSSLVIYQIAAPMLVSLPISNPMFEDEFMDIVHLYPKNVLRGRLPDTGGPDPEPEPTPTPTPTPTPKPTTPGGRLPQTGEAKTFMGVSGLLIVGAVGVIWYKRRTKKEGQ